MTISRFRLTGLILLVSCAAATGCKPDDSPFKAENEALKKQVTKQESLLSSLQDGNKVMQQQIDLLNQELRDDFSERRGGHSQTTKSTLSETELQPA